MGQIVFDMGTISIGVAMSGPANKLKFCTNKRVVHRIKTKIPVIERELAHRAGLARQSDQENNIFVNVNCNMNLQSVFNHS